jgi:PAS domain S-box-containing protein
MTPKHTTENLRENEEIFRLMVDAVQDYAIFMLNSDGYITTWNAGAERITEYTVEDILGKHFSVFYAADERNDKPSHQLQIASKSGRYEEEGWLIRKNGSRFMANILISSSKDASGHVRSFTLIARDISARRKAEERLRESEEEMRLMVDAVQDYGIFMLDPHGRIASWNSGAEKIKGYSAEEILGEHFSKFYPDVERKKGKPDILLKEAAEKGRVETEGWRVRKDGSLFWAEVKITALRDAGGYLRGFCKVTREVRSRIEELWRRIIYSAPNALLMINPIGEIALVNSQTEKLFQYAQDELLGKHINVLIPHHFKGGSEACVMPSKPGEDLYGLRKDGARVPIGIGLNPIQMPEGTFILASVSDLTERRQFERKLATLNEDLERKVKERTALAEQRAAKLQELASVLTLTEQKERGRLAQILHDNLQQMLVASKISLSRLKNQIEVSPQAKLGVAQVEKLLDESIEASRNLTVELSPPVLRDAGLAPALNWLSRWVKEKHGLEIDLESEPNIPNPSEERKVFLFQAVRELLLNIVKHSGADKAIVRMKSKKGALCITVEDHGKGFDPKLALPASHDFTRFGLFNVQERLDMLGCAFHIDSAIGCGTKVTLIAPYEEKKPLSMEVVPPVVLQDRVAEPSVLTRVLVADDHKILRQGLIHALKSCPNIQVIGEAENGQEAVGKALALEPDVIIMDITMPKMNGIEATRRVKQFNPKIKVIGLSLHEAEDMEMTMRRAGASVYLNKSGPIDALIDAIRTVMEEDPSLQREAQ